MKFFCQSVYKLEWDKLRTKQTKIKQEENENKFENATKNIKGEAILLTLTKNSTKNLSGIYLKHSVNESSEDEEGEEKIPEVEQVEENRTAESFRKYIERHKKEQDSKKVESTPSTSMSN